MRPLALLPVLAIALTLGAGYSLSQERVAISGYDFLTPTLQALQDDDFANPGMFWVDTGADLWNEAAGTSGQSCADCHGEGETAMRGVATRYPAYEAGEGRVINLEQRINLERARQGAEPLAYESEELLSLTAYIAHQSKGMPMAVNIEGPAAESFERGKAFFYQRRGQLNLSCANCHEEQAGNRLRGEVISQGQVNGFPIFRSLWQTLASTNRMFAWCNEAVRAEPYPAGSQEYVDLELFARWRGMGLDIEAPAVRR